MKRARKQKKFTVRSQDQADELVAYSIRDHGSGVERFQVIIDLFGMGPLFTRHDVFMYRAWQVAAHRFHPDEFPRPPKTLPPPKKLRDRTWE